MNPQLQVAKTGRYGKRVFVHSGSILDIADENRLRGAVADKPIEISEHFSIGPRNTAELRRMPQHYVNHSCQPNAGFNGQIFMVAPNSLTCQQEFSDKRHYAFRARRDSSGH